MTTRFGDVYMVGDQMEVSKQFAAAAASWVGTTCSAISEITGATSSSAGRRLLAAKDETGSGKWSKVTIVTNSAGVQSPNDNERRNVQQQLKG